MNTQVIENFSTHFSFVNIEEMTPAECKNGGGNLCINYSFAESPFGNTIIASTSKGICYMAFEDDEEQALQGLISMFPDAKCQRRMDLSQQNALLIFQNDWSELKEIKLHLKGTEFQLKVWESLLTIPMGKLSTYRRIAEHIGHPNAARAIGTAVGSNPVAFLIPCHRVIQSSGAFGGYMWGTIRKTAIIGWERAKTYSAI
jgi:AraC family transcriptional regulator, regulatory protein of adaptative response / methylated-DNA-[protein]-cysteine methyltransferase